MSIYYLEINSSRKYGGKNYYELRRKKKGNLNKWRETRQNGGKHNCTFRSGSFSGASPVCGCSAPSFPPSAPGPSPPDPPAHTHTLNQLIN